MGLEQAQFVSSVS